VLASACSTLIKTIIKKNHNYFVLRSVNCTFADANEKDTNEKDTNEKDTNEKDTNEKDTNENKIANE